jgi:hypothetical protein
LDQLIDGLAQLVYCTATLLDLSFFGLTANLLALCQAAAGHPSAPETSPAANLLAAQLHIVGGFFRMAFFEKNSCLMDTCIIESYLARDMLSQTIFHAINLNELIMKKAARIDYSASL